MLSFLLSDSATRNALMLILTPWLLVGVYAFYHYVFRLRWAAPKVDVAAVKPLIHFYSLFTSGASAGYDKEIFQLLHPSLLDRVDKGILRAMMRYLYTTIGCVVDIPLDTVVMKQDGLQVNAVALVHFQKARNVKCQLHYVLRPSVAQGARNFDGSGRFHVLSFHVDMPSLSSLSLTPVSSPTGRVVDHEPAVIDFVELDDFITVGERFIRGMFNPHQRKDMVDLLIPSLREKYLPERCPKWVELDTSMQKTVRAAGQLRDGELDFTLVEAHLLRGNDSAGGDRDRGRHSSSEVSGSNAAAAVPTNEEETKMACGNPEEFPKKPFGSSASGSTEIQGFTQLFHIFGNHRNIEVELRLTLVELTCRVFNFEVRLLPDYRQQVIVDKDAGDVRVM